MGMYSGMVGRVAGTSTGARALGMMGPMAKSVSRGAGRASATMGMRSASSSGATSAMYGAGAKAASAIARHPMRSIGAGGMAAGAGLGAMAGDGRRKGSQNYPMY